MSQPIPPTKHISSQMFKGLNPHSVITRLDDNILISNILQKWEKSTKWKFFVKEDLIEERVKEYNNNSQQVGKSITLKSKSNIHKAPILICTSEKNSSILIIFSILFLN